MFSKKIKAKYYICDMKTSLIKIYLIFAIALLSACKNENPSLSGDRNQQDIALVANSQDLSVDARPKNVIFVIGDGTGINQISALEFYKDGNIFYDEFPVVGLSKVSSTSLITDSAAAGTAMACGEKTFNKAIGVDAQGHDLPNLIEYMEEQGGASGLIATSSLTHATPACFYAHHNHRNDHEIIASYLPKSGVDFFAGAGLKYFNNRQDKVNLLDSLKAHGYMVETSSLKAYPEAQKVGYLLAEKDMPKMLDGRGPFLQEATQLAIQQLSKNDKGFFLMVEGSQVDWGGHDNAFDYMISELIDLDNTLGAILAYAKQDKNTLVVVTGDHATGGLALTADKDDYNKIKPIFSSPGHNADWIPVFAFGPGAESFSGVYENNMLFHKIKALLSPEN